tara:strand:+ start:13359 stop:14990 length:1632 start_codon:yes stop_codon:yes gene_type:complete
MVLTFDKNFKETLFLSFILFATLMPRLGAIDNNAIRWFTISLVSIIYVFYSLRLGNSKFVISKNHLVYASLLFFYLLLSVFIAKNNVEGAIAFYKIVTLVIVFFISYDIFKKNNLLITLCTIFSFSIFIETLVILIQFFDSFEAINGIATNPNISSSSILIKLPFVVFLIKKVKGKWYKLILRMLEFMSIIGVIILGSRLGIISLFVIYFFYFFWYRKFRIAPIFTIGIIITLNFYINNLGNESNLRFNSFRAEKLINDESTNQRLNFYKKAINLSFEKPLFGYGIGSWKYESLPYEENNNKDFLIPYYTHNDFLQIFFELGIIGVAGYLFFFIMLIKKIIAIETELRGFLIITFILFLLNSSLNFPLHRSQEVIPFILVSSMIFCLSNHKSEQKNKVSPYLFIGLVIPIMAISILEHNSLKIQKKLFSDYNLGTFSLSKDELGNINYLVPNLSANGVPLSTYISRYHFENKEYNKSLSLLNLSSKANYKDLMTQELLLKNYIFLGKNNLALEMSKKLMSIYPENSLYSEIYYSLISDEKLKN